MNYENYGYENEPMSDNENFGEIDYPEEPELNYETEQLMDTLDMDYETVVEQLNYTEEDIREAVILHASHRLEEYVLNENFGAVEEILKNNGLIFIDEYLQTNILQIACCHCCPNMIKLLCQYEICGDNWTNFEETFTDFEKVFDNFKTIVDMNYFYKVGDWLLYCLWESDTLPRQGRRRIVNYLNETELLNEVRVEYMKKEIKEQFDRQFLPTLESKFPFGVNHIVSNYLCT